MMYSSIANTTFSYILTINEIRNRFPEDKRPSWVKLSTITIISKISTDVNINKIKSVFNNLKKISLKMKNSKHSGFEWFMKDTQFFNQITLSYTDCYSCKSIKLFPNGAVQIAGCSDLFDCKRVISQLVYLLNSILKLEKQINSSDFRIVMINTNFNVNQSLNLHLAVNEFKQNNCKVSFDPDRYSAVKIKFKPAEEMKEVTVSVFSTGKIIITGAETLKEISLAYNFVNEVINSNEKIRVGPMIVHDKHDYFLGYKMENWVKFLEQNNFKSWFFTVKNFKINF